MTYVTRILLLSTLIPLAMADQADACWRCWRSHHSCHYASNGGEAGVGAIAGEGVPVAAEAAELTPKKVSPKAGEKNEPQKDQPIASDIGSKLDSMKAQLDRIEAKLKAPEAVGGGTPESAIGAMVLERVAGSVLASVLKDFENRLGGVGVTPAVVTPVDQDADAKRAFISLLSDKDVRKALKEAVK
jgi:hypothetical protein